MSQSKQQSWLSHLEGVSARLPSGRACKRGLNADRLSFTSTRVPNASKQTAEFKYRLMREDREVYGWPLALGVHVNREVLAEVAVRVRAEVASVCLRSGAPEMLAFLRGRGLRIAICSNLASPYAPCLRRHLSGKIDHFVLSCEVGAMKPEAAIYERVEMQLGVDRNRILFVGDSKKADIEGPHAFGFRSMHIDEML